MTDAPERIWADGDETGLSGFCDWLWVRGSWNRSKEGVGEVEYIRADLVEAMEAENQRLRESLQECLEIVESVSDKRAYRALKSRAHAALRSTEASHE